MHRRRFRRGKPCHFHASVGIGLVRTDLDLRELLRRVFRRFGVLGLGIGSQILIGQLLSCNAGAKNVDLATIVLAVLLAIVASVVPRTLSGPAEQPATAVPCSTEDDGSAFSEVFMELQAAIAALSIVVLGHFVGLTESAWAIAACTYVVASSPSGCRSRRGFVLRSRNVAYLHRA